MFVVYSDEGNGSGTGEGDDEIEGTPFLYPRECSIFSCPNKDTLYCFSFERNSFKSDFQ